MPLLQVPVIDITPLHAGDLAARRQRAAEIDRACRDIGFLVISGHGVAETMLDEVAAVSRAFFTIETAEKQRIARPGMDIARGYIGLGAESVARSQGILDAPGDLNESLMIGPVDVSDTPYYRAPAAGRHFHPNLWPARPPALRPLYEQCFRDLSRLAATIMRGFALALELDEAFFDPLIDRHISRLRVRRYPAQPQPPAPGQLRVGAHSDYGSLTILRTEDAPGGLQVFNRAGDWVGVPIIPGTFIINIGELMARWTNDRWRATLHRVVNPPRAEAHDSERLSIVFFHNPNYDTDITCLPTCTGADTPPRYPPTTSGAHLRGQFTRTQAA